MRKGIREMMKYAAAMLLAMASMALHTGCATTKTKTLAAEEQERLRDAGFTDVNLTDDFDNVTSTGLWMKVAGDFSNSATSSSPAYAAIVAENGEMWIRIWEYSRERNCVSFASRRVNPVVRIQDNCGVQSRIPANGFSNRIELHDPAALAAALQTGGVRIVVTFNEYPGYGVGSTYRFAIGGGR